MSCLDPRALYVTVVSGDEWYLPRVPLSRAAGGNRTGARGPGAQLMPCCRAVPTRKSSLSGGFDFDLVLPSEGSVLQRGFVRNRTRCHQRAQFQSAMCQAGEGLGRTSLACGQLFRSREPEDIPRRASSMPYAQPEASSKKDVAKIQE